MKKKQTLSKEQKAKMLAGTKKFWRQWWKEKREVEKINEAIDKRYAEIATAGKTDLLDTKLYSAPGAISNLFHVRDDAFPGADAKSRRERIIDQITKAATASPEVKINSKPSTATVSLVNFNAEQFAELQGKFARVFFVENKLYLVGKDHTITVTASNLINP